MLHFCSCFYFSDMWKLYVNYCKLTELHTFSTSYFSKIQNLFSIKNRPKCFTFFRLTPDFCAYSEKTSNKSFGSETAYFWQKSQFFVGAKINLRGETVYVNFLVTVSCSRSHLLCKISNFFGPWRFISHSLSVAGTDLKWGFSPQAS